VYIPSAPVYNPFTPVRARVVSVRACRTNVRARRIYVDVPENIIRARRRTVRALEHPVRAGINAFAPEGLRETTAACARGTISPRPFATTQCPKPLYLGLQLHKQLLARYVVGEDKS
jgi:hypothetical protein